MNPLASLIGNYGDSDEESDNESGTPRSVVGRNKERPLIGMQNPELTPSASIHPAPIAHCPWSACYDESSGFTYYWNQQTNAVTWEAPPEYLLALKLAQQQLHSQGSTEVSVEEWQLYQQALAEKQQSKMISKGALIKPVKNNEKTVNINNKNNKKRKLSDVEDEKIELITSYYNSDSESNEEPETQIVAPPSQPPLPKPTKIVNKKIKPKPPIVQYGPTLPSNQDYSMPIGPELPQDKNHKPKSPDNKLVHVHSKEELKKPKSANNEDSNDESVLLTKLKDKAKLLERLGGELPSGIQEIIEEETRALNTSPKLKDIKPTEDNIDELLNEIETKELPKVKTRRIDMFDEVDLKSNDSPNGSPKSRGMTPPIEHKPLFPSIKNISEEQPQNPVTNVNNELNATENIEKVDISVSAVEKKGANLYLMDNEPMENIGRKKLRLSNSVLPERKKNETPSYTTKYSEHIEGFSNERTGLGFVRDEDTEGSVKNTISYGNGVTFTKGETLNEEKKDEDLDNLTDLVEAKLKYLNQLQPCTITPVQEMLIQMQTLGAARAAGALGAGYWARWARAAGRALAAQEAGAAPPGWTCAFLRSEGRYQYRREADGFIQWEYPAVASTDMDISMTPPHPGIEEREEIPPLPPSPPLPPPPPPAPQPRAGTPPPPAWPDPPPPGCDDALPPPAEQHREIRDELTSFYNDIAELEKHTPDPPTASSSPSPPHSNEHIDKDSKVRDRDNKVNKKKSKVKISSSVGLKHRSVSTLVAKWQQVADEISSD